MFFKNISNIPPDSAHSKNSDENPYNKIFSGLSKLQPSLYPSASSKYMLEKEEKPLTNKSFLENIKLRSDMSIESPDCIEDEKNLKAELQETKSKMKVVSGKLANTRKERDQLQKENRALQEEILTLQVSLRHMVPGFSNSSCSFPLYNELVTNVANFYKNECENIFFDVLSSELSMKGIIFFFKTSFERLMSAIEDYFKPSEDLLKQTGCMEDLEGPLMSALRKSYQANWREVVEKCLVPSLLSDITKEIQRNLRLQDDSQEAREEIESFLRVMGELLLSLRISDPQFMVKSSEIGNKVVFNPMKHEALDGFIKAKDECILILPSVYKNSMEGEMVSKARVLQIGYELLN